jgi:tRNA(Ile)-lysidine synthase
MTIEDIASKELGRWLQPGDRILAAVSGGPDSVALAHWLRGKPYSVVIGHVDHQLRKGSAGDARFVKELAREWDIPCRVSRVNVKAYAKSHHLGLEEAARTLRYRALAAMAKKDRCAAIVTAHTADDQAETVLMNFLRGAGPTGLAGMPARRVLNDRRETALVRPFLSVAKSKILLYLESHSLLWRQDPTNASHRFSRNRIRHATLPYLEEYYPGLSERLLQNADVFRQEELYWQKRVEAEFRKTVRRKGARFSVVLTRLLGYHKALSRRILRRILPGFSFQDIEDVFTLARSPERKAWLHLPGEWRAKHENNLLVIQKRTG